MSDIDDAADQAQPLHYQVLCGLALGFVFVIFFEQGSLLAALLLATVGLWGILYAFRWGPVLFLAALGWIQSAPYFGWRGLGVRESTLDVAHVALAAAVLTYVAGQYRLQALWHNIVPLDPRQRAGPPRRRFPWFRALPATIPHRRPSASLTRKEIGGLVLSVPLWVGLAFAAWLFVTAPLEVYELPPRWRHLLLAAWLVLLPCFLVQQGFQLWNRLRLSRAAALLLLQDELWKETRAEQRSAQRWLAWWKIRQQDQPKNKPRGESSSPAGS